MTIEQRVEPIEWDGHQVYAGANFATARVSHACVSAVKLQTRAA